MQHTHLLIYLLISSIVENSYCIVSYCFLLGMCYVFLNRDVFCVTYVLCVINSKFCVLCCYDFEAIIFMRRIDAYVVRCILMKVAIHFIGNVLPNVYFGLTSRGTSTTLFACVVYGWRKFEKYLIFIKSNIQRIADLGPRLTGP